MTTSNHMYTGVIVAMAVGNPIVGLPLALLSHFVLDALPHYGYGNEGYGYNGAFRHKLTWVIESTNLIALPLLVYMLIGHDWWVWAAAILAISPDFAWVYRYVWFERKGLPPPGGAIVRFHKRIQWCERSWGILIEIPFLILLLLVVWNMLR